MTQVTAIRRYVIRHACPADIPAIRAMQERSMWVLGGNFYTSNEIASFLAAFGTMDDTIVDEGHYFVAEDHRGAILGSGGWSRSNPSYAGTLSADASANDAPTIRSVFVDPAAARRGVGSAIVVRTERDATEHDLHTLHLTATLSGVALYEKLGYHMEEATELELPNQTRFACVRMVKPLARLRRHAASVWEAGA